MTRRHPHLSHHQARQKRNDELMRLRSLAIAAVASVALMAPASAGAVTLIGSRGNAGVKDGQAGVSMFAGQGRTPLPSDAGTTYGKLDPDGFGMDGNPKHKL